MAVGCCTDLQDIGVNQLRLRKVLLKYLHGGTMGQPTAALTCARTANQAYANAAGATEHGDTIPRNATPGTNAMGGQEHQSSAKAGGSSQSRGNRHPTKVPSRQSNQWRGPTLPTSRGPPPEIGEPSEPRKPSELSELERELRAADHAEAEQADTDRQAALASVNTVNQRAASEDRSSMLAHHAQPYMVAQLSKLRQDFQVITRYCASHGEPLNLGCAPRRGIQKCGGFENIEKPSRTFMEVTLGSSTGHNK